jgi:ADP-ribose pyrophosphatase
MKAEIVASEILHAGFFELRRLTVEHDLFAGGRTKPLRREILHGTDVTAAILFDPRSDRVVLTEQYRPGAHVAGIDPWLLDIVAGRIDQGESPAEAIRREIEEESGLIPDTVCLIGRYLTAPHLSSEQVHLYCATVDASRAAGTHGLAHEGEDIRLVTLDRVDAVSLPSSRPLSLWAALALSWLENRPKGQRAEVE